MLSHNSKCVGEPLLDSDYHKRYVKTFRISGSKFCLY